MTYALTTDPDTQVSLTDQEIDIFDEVDGDYEETLPMTTIFVYRDDLTDEEIDEILNTPIYEYTQEEADEDDRIAEEKRELAWAQYQLSKEPFTVR